MSMQGGAQLLQKLVALRAAEAKAAVVLQQGRLALPLSRPRRSQHTLARGSCRLGSASVTSASRGHTKMPVVLGSGGRWQ